MRRKKGKIDEIDAVRTEKICNRNLPLQYGIIHTITDRPDIPEIPASICKSTDCLHLNGRFARPAGTGRLATCLHVPKAVRYPAQNPDISGEAANVLIA